MAHHLAREQDLERVDRVLAAQVIAAAADLLRQDRPSQGEDGEGVRHRHRDQERQEHVQIVRELDGEDHPGERGTHRPAEDRSHADERPEARAFVGEKRRLHATQRPPQQQEGRQDAARGAGAERYAPDDPLDDQDTGEHAARNVTLQERADRVVADAEGLREDEPS